MPLVLPGDATRFREMAMKRYWFVVLSYVLLLAAVGFALDLGVLAMMLRS